MAALGGETEHTALLQMSFKQAWGTVSTLALQAGIEPACFIPTEQELPCLVPHIPSTINPGSSAWLLVRVHRHTE